MALALLASGGLVGATALVRMLGGGAESKPALAVAEPTVWSARWVKGLEYTFSFAWAGQTHALLSPGSTAQVDVAYDLAGDLVVGATEQAGRTVLELRFDRVTRHTLRALGLESVPTDEDARSLLEQPRAFAVVASSGAIEQLRFPADAPRPMREALTKLVEQMQVTVPSQPSTQWVATEPGPNGRVSVRYQGDGLHVTRTRLQYESLTAMPGGACPGCTQQLTDRSDVTLDARGIVSRLDDAEILHVAARGAETFVSENHFSLKLERVAPLQGEIASLDSATDVRTPGEPAALSTGDQDEVLRSLAAGYTQAQLDQAIDLYARKGQELTDRTWLVHARAYLRLHPEAVDSLAARLARPDLGSRGRDMVLQVLAVVGNPRAQEIMRAALVAPPVGAPTTAYVALVQKLGVVEHPTDETRAFVADGYRTARGQGARDVALADAATLGTIAGRLAKGDDPLAARRIVRGLEQDLRDAKVPEERRGLILALRGAGAAGSDEVRSYASDDNATVRDEVARSLAQVPTAEARATLLTLSGDGDLGVATSAVQSLDRDGATNADAHALAGMLVADQTPRGLDAQVMDFFAGHLDSPDAVSVLTFILARTKDPSLARRVRALLEQVAS